MLTVNLVHGPNPDIRGGYWAAPVDTRRFKVAVVDLADAVTVFEDWRDRNGLGSGNMTRGSGAVSDGGRPVARIRYNGTVEYIAEPADYDSRCRALEAEGLTRSDAQAVVEAQMRDATDGRR